MRVWQAPDVEDQVRVDGDAMLVPETDEVDDHLRPARCFARQLLEHVAQLVNRQVGRVEDEIRHRSDGVQLRPLLANRLGQRSVPRQRMRTAGLAEPAYQSRMARFEKD